MRYDDYVKHLEKTGLTLDRIKEMGFQLVPCEYCDSAERCLGWTLERLTGEAWIPEVQ